MTEKEFSKVVTSVCNGESFVTVTGAFFELVSFLEGYGKGVGLVPAHSVFTPFLQWFNENKLRKKSREMLIRWYEFRDLYSSDEESLEKLSTLYQEYVKSLTPPD
jgi:hypothetical protein